MVNRRCSPLGLAILLAGCSGDALPPAPQLPAGPAGPARAADGRWLLSLSREGLAVKGGWVQIGRTTKTELEPLLGPLQRTVLLKGRLDPVGLWDSKGIRIYFSKRTGVVDVLDCVFTAGSAELDPQQPFDGLFQLEGVEISRSTTKAALPGRVGARLHDLLPEVPGFSTIYEHHGAVFRLTKDRSALDHVRIIRAVSKR